MDAVVQNSREMIEKGSKSFATASRLFDTQTRDHATMLYAWCRYCDDVIDGQEMGFGQATPPKDVQRSSLDQLYTETKKAMSGAAVTDDVYLALQRVTRECDIPEQHPLELLKGFAMDVDERQYRSLDDTLTYCYHVAGVVGVMMAMVMGVRDTQILHRACDLGLAFQLTNICRDVMEDASVGRIYLPLDWLDEAGVPNDPASFSEHKRAVYGVVQRVLIEADRYYASSLKGLPHLSFRSAWAIAAARNVYREIGLRIQNRGVGALDSRSIISKNRKLYLAILGGGRAVSSRFVPGNRGGEDRVGLWTRPLAA